MITARTVGGAVSNEERLVAEILNFGRYVRSLRQQPHSTAL